MYHIHAKHDGLQKYRRLSGTDEYVLEQRARLQTDLWEERWRRQEILRRHSEELLDQLPDFEAQKAFAARLNAEAKKKMAALINILPQGLEAKPFKIELLYDTRIYPEPRPVEPRDQTVPREPVRSDPVFEVHEIDLKDLWPLLLLSGDRRRERSEQLRLEASDSKYEAACQAWLETKASTIRQNAKARALFELNLDEWWEKAQAYQKLQRRENVKVDKFRSRYAQGKPDAVIEFLDAVLSHLEMPEMFPSRWELGYCAEAGALIIDYDLPPPKGFPSLTAVRFDVLRDVFDESHLSEFEVAQLYDNAMRQACLRILHGVAAADDADVLVSIAFNGWVNVTDETSDTSKRICVMSVETSKSAISQEISAAADARAQFKSLRAAAGENLSGLAPVTPARLPKGAQVWTMAAHDDEEFHLELGTPLPLDGRATGASRA